MAYVRWAQKLPSGAESRYYVFGGPDGLICEDSGRMIGYDSLRRWLKDGNDEEVKEMLGKRLEINGEELDVVCARLIEERDAGKWDKARVGE